MSERLFDNYSNKRVLKKVMINFMNSLIKNLNSKKSKNILFYIAYAGILTALLSIGLSANASAINNQHKSNQQYKQQNKTALVQKIHHNTNLNQNQNKNKNNNYWFRDGLNNQNLKARGWVSWHESRNNWKVLSYGHRCIGYFQLDPKYLGRKDGHVNLDHKHQVKVADKYAKVRYGNWMHAKHFWQIHHWY